MAIPRALVQANARQALTDSQGRFEFAQFADARATITVIKPGYTMTSDPGGVFMPHLITDLDAPVEVKLYPDALITGSVTGADGLPLAQVQVTVRRAVYDVSGVRWDNAGFSQTDSRGEYRFKVPPGRYRLATAYLAHTRDTGEALLPAAFPDGSDDRSSSSLDLAAGDERRIDLRPRMGQAHTVLLRVDGMDAPGNLRFSARGNEGGWFNVNYSPGGAPSEYRIELPNGTYLLRGQSDSRDETMEGESRVTVAGGRVAGLTMHMTPQAAIPVEVAVSLTAPSQDAARNTPPPTAQQLNLYLHAMSETAEMAYQDVGLRGRGDKALAFHVPPGRYRLGGQMGGSWYVESATYGGVTNLLSSEILIAPGSAGAAIRVVISNLRGTVHGSVAASGDPANPWVYLFPRQPALAMPNPVLVSGTGSFAISAPVGSYAVVAFSHRLQEDLRDPEAVERLTASSKTVDVTSGGDVAVTLEVSEPKGRLR